MHGGGGLVGVAFIPIFAAAGSSLEHFGGLGSLLVPAMLLLVLAAMHLGRSVGEPA